MKQENAIEIKNLNKTFYLHEDKKSTLRALFTSFFNQGKTREFRALNNINLEIKRGEFVGIVGRNGSGKSTFLKIIAGIYNANKGSVVNVRGGLVPFLELGVGFNPDLSGRENIFLNGTILGMTNSYLKRKFNDIVEFADLKDFIEVPVKNYSSGMMVRLAFSIAIQSDADIYLLDEILAVGDENFQKKSAQVIRKFKEAGKTILFVSHNMDSINAYCDRAILIDKSQLLMDGSPYLVTQQYKKLNNDTTVMKSENPYGAGKRWGNHDVEIGKVEILNAKDELSNDFTEVGDIKVRMHYKIHNNKHTEIVFGAGIYRRDGMHITGTNTQIAGLKLDLKKEGIIEYKVSNKYLLDEEYSFTLAVFDGLTNETLDYHSSMYPFKIRLNNKDHGSVSLPTTWEVLSAN